MLAAAWTIRRVGEISQCFWFKCSLREPPPKQSIFAGKASDSPKNNIKHVKTLNKILPLPVATGREDHLKELPLSAQAALGLQSEKDRPWDRPVLVFSKNEGDFSPG